MLYQGFFIYVDIYIINPTYLFLQKSTRLYFI